MADPQVYPNWKDTHGVVHIVGLHTNRRIHTECMIVIVESDNVFVQVKHFDPCYEAVNCLTCLVNFEPY